MLDIVKIVMGLFSDGKFLDLFKGKEAKLQEFQLDLMEKLQSLNLAQIQLNSKEAENRNLFVSGWRPAIGWVCGFSLAYNFILQPLIIAVVNIWKPEFELPTLELEYLMSILTAMLGMYGVRTYEKIKMNDKK